MDSQSHIRFSKRLLSHLISALLVGQSVAPAMAATITPQGNTAMDKAPNGVPVVNIATPNGAGISHNQFKDYNVGKEGLILNNSAAQQVNTQLGGQIGANPHLQAGQEARGIINEVTGGNRSQLQGYTEVAGKAANVMVANPYGITCNGCGFINTPNVTLTTGKPQFDAAGNVQALEVTKGSITVEGSGLDASGSDALSLISRATEVNAAIHAKSLEVIAGANRVKADGSITSINGEGEAPVVAVDTGALGGMYANRIRLVSSEKGVGVNLGNLNARQGDIQLDASGKLTLSGSNQATGAMTVQSGEQLVNQGELRSGGDMRLMADSIVNKKGRITAGDSLWLQKDAAGNANREVVNSSGTVETLRGDITIDTAHLQNEREGLEGTINGVEWRYSNGVYQQDGKGESVAASPIEEDKQDRLLGTISSSLTVNNVQPEGRIHAARDLNVSAVVLDNAASTLSAGNDANLRGETLNNFSWLAGSDTYHMLLTDYGQALFDAMVDGNDATYYQLLNDYRQSLTGSTSDFSLIDVYSVNQSAEALRGLIQAGGTLNGSFGGEITNTSWRANASSLPLVWWSGSNSAISYQLSDQMQRLAQSGSELDPLLGSAISGSRVVLQAAEVTNHSSVLAGSQELTVTSTGALHNRSSGVISSNGALNLTAAADIINTGALISGEQVALVSEGGSIINKTVEGEIFYVEREEYQFVGDYGWDNVYQYFDTAMPADTGTIRATTSLDLQAAEDISLEGAEMHSGGLLQMLAGGDIGLFSLETEQTIMPGDTEGNGQKRVSALVSQLMAGEMYLEAGGDIISEGGQFAAGGNMQLSAAGDIDLQSAEARTEMYRGDYGNSDQYSVDGNGTATTLTSGGNMTLNAENMYSEGTVFDAVGNLRMEAGQGISLRAGYLTEDLYVVKSDYSEDYSRSSMNLYSDRRLENRLNSGTGITLRAGEDIYLEGVQMTAVGNIAVDSGGSLMLGSAGYDQSMGYDSLDSIMSQVAASFLPTVNITADDGDYRLEGNLANRFSAGHINLKAQDDLLLEGGVLYGSEGVLLTAGQNVQLASIWDEIRHDEDFGSYWSWENTQVLNGGLLLITSDESIQVQAGQDIETYAAGLAAQEITLVSGQNIALNALELQYDKYGLEGDNYWEESSVRRVKSELTSVGDIILEAEGRVRLSGARLDAGGA